MPLRITQPVPSLAGATTFLLFGGQLVTLPLNEGSVLALAPTAHDFRQQHADLIPGAEL